MVWRVANEKSGNSLPSYSHGFVINNGSHWIGVNGKLFTGVLFDTYDTPNDFCNDFTNSLKKRTIFPGNSLANDDEYNGKISFIVSIFNFE